MSQFDATFLSTVGAELLTTHGETITWTPAGGAGLEITAVVLRRASDRATDEDGEIERHEAEVQAVVDIAEGDSVTFDSYDWVVDEIVNATSSLRRCRVRRTRIAERSGGDRRARRASGGRRSFR